MIVSNEVLFSDLYSKVKILIEELILKDHIIS